MSIQILIQKQRYERSPLLPAPPTLKSNCAIASTTSSKMEQRKTAVDLGCSLLIASGCKTEVEKPDEEPKQRTLVAPDPMTALVIGDNELGSRIARQWSARRDGELSIVDKTAEEFWASEFEIDPSVDIVIYPPSMVDDLVEHERIQKIAKHVWTSDEFNKNELLRHYRTSIVRHVNESWAVPLGNPNFAMLCNRALFQDLDPPKTWEEVDRRLKNIQALIDQGELKTLTAKIDMPLSKGWAVQIFLARVAPAIRNRGKISTVFDRSTMNPLITETPFVEALEQIQAIASERSLELDPAAVYELARAGKSSIAFSWPARGFGEEPDDEAKDEDESESDTLLIRSLPGMKKWFDNSSGVWAKRSEEDDIRVDLIGFEGLVASVSQSASNDAAAWEFVQWLPSKTVSLLTVVDSPRVGPFRASHLGDASRWTGDGISMEVADEYADVVADNHQRTLVMMFPRIPGQRGYLDSLDHAIRECVSGKSTAEDALKVAAAKWDEISNSLDRKNQIKKLKEESRF